MRNFNENTEGVLFWNTVQQELFFLTKFENKKETPIFVKK